MDYAIKNLSSCFKSVTTNLIRGNIKKFKMKFLKYDRESEVMEIEKQYNTIDSICPNIFGDVKYEYNNKPYKLNNIDSNVKIQYKSLTNEYILLIPIKTQPKKIDNKPLNIVVLDPGLRTFMTGLSEKNGAKFGCNVNQIIVKDIEKINFVKFHKKMPSKRKKKHIIRINKKIHNKIDELHWKTIKLLTDTCDNILLGDMSAKSIVARKNKILSPSQKTACLRTRYYEFMQRLKYKCAATQTNFRYVDEMYTSKLCSLCGYYNEKLGGDSTYDCPKCKQSMDRDINACRNILIKNM